jgi:Fe-S-cluster-containing hydrogenase component 2
MANIISLTEILGKIQSTNIALHPERCVAVRNRNASCRKCAEACTSGAIAVVDNEIDITPDLCIGCGTCATVCPSAALEALNPSDNELLRDALAVLREGGTDPVFICSQVFDTNKDLYDKSRVIEVTCLGRLEETELIALIAGGVSSLVLVRDVCADCPNQTGAKTIELIQENTDTLLKAWNHENPVRIVEGIPQELKVSKKEARQRESASGVSRRDFFKQIKREAQGAVVSAAGTGFLAGPQELDITTKVTKVTKDGTLPHFLPGRRERLITYLEALGEPVVETVNTRLWGRMHINKDSCNSCKMCATFCPTGALSKFLDSDGTMGLEHYPADCIQCKLCQDSCSVGALTLSSTASVQELVEGTIIRFELDPHPIFDAPDEGNYKPPLQVKVFRDYYKDTLIRERG